MAATLQSLIGLFVMCICFIRQSKNMKNHAVITKRFTALKKQNNKARQVRAKAVKAYPFEIVGSQGKTDSESVCYRTDTANT